MTRAQETRFWVMLAAAAMVDPTVFGLLVAVTTTPALGIIAGTFTLALTFAMAGVATNGYGKGPRP